MSNRLSIDEERKSKIAVSEYLKDNGILTLGKTVAVVRNGELIINDQIEVAASNRGIYTRVDILWEDAGIEDYNDLGLYGSYGSNYYRMSYDAGILKIHTDEGIEITIS
jgi:hypothetical protein